MATVPSSGLWQLIAQIILLGYRVPHTNYLPKLIFLFLSIQFLPFFIVSVISDGI